MRRVAAFAIVAVIAAVASSVLAADHGVPDKYRFTGWMAPSEAPSEWPKHVLFEGDAGTLRFADARNLKRKPVPYTVCAFKRSSSRGQCEHGLAPADTRPSVLPVFVHCCGQFVAKWYVAGRVVATWPFLYAPETE